MMLTCLDLTVYLGRLQHVLTTSLVVYGCVCLLQLVFLLFIFCHTKALFRMCLSKSTSRTMQACFLRLNLPLSKSHYSNQPCVLQPMHSTSTSPWSSGTRSRP